MVSQRVWRGYVQVRRRRAKPERRFVDGAPLWRAGCWALAKATTAASLMLSGAHTEHEKPRSDANISKRSKSRGGVILRFTGSRESDSFWECYRSRILTVFHTPS